MKIHELEYLPVEAVVIDGLAAECGAITVPDVEAVSLYGHWVHIRYTSGRIESIPAHHVHSILWS